MASLTNSIEKLISSIFGIVQNIANSILAVITSILALFQTFVVSLFELGKSFVGFLLSNIVILSVIAVGLVAYTAFIQRSASGQGTGKKVAY